MGFTLKYYFYSCLIGGISLINMCSYVSMLFWFFLFIVNNRHMIYSG